MRYDAIAIVGDSSCCFAKPGGSSKQKTIYNLECTVARCIREAMDRELQNSAGRGITPVGFKEGSPKEADKSRNFQSAILRTHFFGFESGKYEWILQKRGRGISDHTCAVVGFK